MQDASSQVSWGDYRPTLVDLQVFFDVAGQAAEGTQQLAAESPLREALLLFVETAGRMSDELVDELGPGTDEITHGVGLSDIAEEVRAGLWMGDRKPWPLAPKHAVGV